MSMVREDGIPNIIVKVIRIIQEKGKEEKS